MKTKVVKILKIILLLFIISLVYSCKVQASEASISATSCKVGESFTVTINIPHDVVGYDVGSVTATFSDGSQQTER